MCMYPQFLARNSYDLKGKEERGKRGRGKKDNYFSLSLWNGLAVYNYICDTAIDLLMKDIPHFLYCTPIMLVVGLKVVSNNHWIHFYSWQCEWTCT